MFKAISKHASDPSAAPVNKQEETLVHLGTEFRKVDGERFAQDSKRLQSLSESDLDNLDSNWWAIVERVISHAPTTDGGMRVTAYVLAAILRDCSEPQDPVARCARTLVTAILDQVPAS